MCAVDLDRVESGLSRASRRMTKILDELPHLLSCKGSWHAKNAVIDSTRRNRSLAPDHIGIGLGTDVNDLSADLATGLMNGVRNLLHAGNVLVTVDRRLPWLLPPVGLYVAVSQDQQANLTLCKGAQTAHQCVGSKSVLVSHPLPHGGPHDSVLQFQIAELARGEHIDHGNLRKGWRNERARRTSRRALKIWALGELNPGPTGYESAALTTELRALTCEEYVQGKRTRQGNRADRRTGGQAESGANVSCGRWPPLPRTIRGEPPPFGRG